MTFSDDGATAEPLDTAARGLHTVLQVAEALNQSNDVADVIERAVDAIVSYTRFPACGLFRLDPTGAWLDMIAHRNLSPEVFDRARRLPVEGSLTGHAIRTGAVVTTRDLARDDRLEPATRAALASEGYADVASVPLIHQGAPLGAINFIYQRDAEPPSALEREILLGIGRTVAMALANRTAEEERRRLETQVRKAEQIEHLGLIAGGLAHDFNNLLTGIIGALSLGEQVLSDPHGDPGSLTPLLEDALKASLRASGLVRQLLTFSKGGAPILRPTDRLGELIRESAEFSAHGASIRLEFDLAPDLHTVRVDGGQLAQVVQNLVINAIQASPAGGAIRIEAANERAEGDSGPGWVCIRVVDRGHGIPADLLGRIFDPYVTTRPGGSGLGLPTVRSVVARHGGRVEIDSRVGEGTTVRVLLPATIEPVPAEPTTAPEPRAPRGGRALAMDDEASIRNLARALLEREGYQVVAVGRGEEAVAACERAVAEGRPFDVVVLDLTVVGGMGGREAMERIRALCPNVAAVVSSGYSQEAVMASHQEHGFDVVLQKPYTPAQFGEAVRQARLQREAAGLVPSR